MNIKLLNKVKQAILARPLQFEMETWFRVSPEIPECHTTACIAGWAITLGKQPRAKMAKPSKIVVKLLGEMPRFRAIRGEHCRDVHKLADPLLGLTSEQADRLYSTSAWPLKYKAAYESAKTSLAQAKVAAKRIDHFIKTNGDE